MDIVATQTGLITEQWVPRSLQISTSRRYAVNFANGFTKTVAFGLTNAYLHRRCNVWEPIHMPLDLD